jgi:diguanylate cyclase (GGDEF)-like protein
MAAEFSKFSADQKLEILVVEDSPTQALLLEQILIGEGFSVSRAPNGQKALELLQSRVPTLVITDVVMPQMDGYELCRRIKSSSEFRHLPVILLTDLSNPGDILKGLEVGADNFISKPYSPDLLTSRVRYILANNEIRKMSGTEIGVKINYGGQVHFLTAERIQIIDFLISSLDTAIRNYYEIHEANRLLAQANEKIRKQSEELRALSLTDQLTKLNNRRGFFTLANQQLKLARRANWDVLLVFADIDRFKAINDEYGHKEGDLALIEVADIFRTTCRESDVIGRLGGDEFAVMAAGSADNGVVNLTARLEENFNMIKQTPGRAYGISVSSGAIVCRPEEISSLEELIHRADQKMYDNKRKNRG